MELRGRRATCNGLNEYDADELLDACEALLAERESVRDAALEEAARAVENDCGIGIQHGDKIRALKGKR